MPRPSIKSSLIGVLTLISILFGIFAYLSHAGSASLHETGQNLGSNAIPAIVASGQLDHTFMSLRLAVAKHIIATDVADMAKLDVAIVATEVEFNKAVAAYKASIDKDSERVALETIEAKSKHYLDALPALFDLSRQHKTDEAADIFIHKLAPIANDLNADIQSLVAGNVEEAIEATGVADEGYARDTLTTLVTTCLVGLVICASILFILRAVANPIGTITGAMSKLAEGDVTIEIPFAGRADEIGAMASAVETFRQAAIDNARLQRDAEANRLQAEVNRTADQKRAEAEADERLNLAASALAAGLKRLASGDLAFQLTEAFSPGFEGLRLDFNSSVSQLGETLLAMSESIASMDNGTKEISSGANDLSRRTEQQAASLEETAAALDQITANVANSSKRTGEARIAAAQANQSAVKSAEVVSYAEDAMGRIETSSQQISSIIGVIDEIAFQTNLLALNAGVEAARAGEAGRGFAVVAQEVRELAQRSAKAAKEIKGLIQNSNTEVESGVRLVRETGMALKTIGSQISEINGHMDSIATSAKEQATGLAEINTAVNSMDQSTQQNAAMVEESTAASDGLANEATKLRDLVSHFQLGNTNVSPVVALRQTAAAMAAPRRSVTAGRPASQGNTALKQGWTEF